LPPSEAGKEHKGRNLSGNCTVRVRFHRPSAALQPYFTTFYLTEIEVAGGGRVQDHLHPEWGGLRIFQGPGPDAAPLGGEEHIGIRNIAHGPTATTIRFRIGSGRCWGVGFLPAGWAKFIGTGANRLANRIVDGAVHETFARFRPLIASLFDEEPSESEELARMEAHFLGRLDEASPDEDRIIAAHQALVDPVVGSVHEMAEACGMKAHTLERLCRRHFGFTPSLLLRRQRFMRSVAQFMLDPSLKWIGATDQHYHDQAQFIRDFHRFMGMNPREYAAMPHPILDAVMRARAAAAGEAVQALHPPQPSH